MIKRFDVAIGNARAEGRAPSHDGEYLAIYYNPGADGWIAEDNGGGIYASTYGTADAAIDADASDDDIDAWRAIDVEIATGVLGDAGDIARSCGSAAAATMIEWGWATPAQFDDGTFGSGE